MKKIIAISVAASLALALALPISADVVKAKTEGLSDKADKQVKKLEKSDWAQFEADVTKQEHAITKDQSSNVSADAAQDAADSVNPEALRQLEERVHLSYRGFARRLNQVEADVVEQAKQGERWTSAEVQQHRERINKIRARFRDKADKRGSKLSKTEIARFEADVKARENAAAAARD